MSKTRLPRAILLCPLFIFIMQQSWAQKSVTGKVTDEKGGAVAGASVLVKGSSSGTSTDAAGSFKITMPSDANRLVISFVGYTTTEVIVPSSNEVTISLKPDNAALTDVVV